MSEMYGRRDLYDRGSARLVVCPSGRQFLQNAPSTYQRTTVPMVPVPEGRASKIEGIRRGQGKEGSMINTMGQALLDAGDAIHRYEVARELSESGRAWLITVQSPTGKTSVISRLRSWREGNGF